jgi:hypothetical protein
MFGCGLTRLQPAYVEDVAEAVDRLGRGRHRNRKRRACLLHGFVTSRYVAAFLGTIVKRRHHKQMAHVLWQQRCLEVASRLHHVRVVDETRRTYRHHGRQRDALRRIATFRHATQRVAPHRYATLEPLGKPGGSRAFSADGPPSSTRGSETPIAASRRLKPRRSANEGAGWPRAARPAGSRRRPYFGGCKSP